MSAKLIVHKFDSGIHLKSLHITINEYDNGSHEVKFSKWLDEKIEKKGSVTHPRLVVKIVSDSQSNLDYFSLDFCAEKLDQYLSGTNSNEADNLYVDETFGKVSNNKQDQSEDLYLTHNLLNLAMKCKTDMTCNFFNNKYPANDGDVISESPLEYSLEKVKENNARIMENIHMLNRTLNYTKEREILDVGCSKAMRTYPCNNCGKCFVYETGLRRHYSIRHAITEIQPRWQVVWTCIECFQVWPRQDLAIKHSLQCCKTENIDCVREIKTSSILQCEFCEKVFTSIPRMLKHSKAHTTANNYECNVCEKSFLSYKLAEQHWLTCPWLKLCYNFSLTRYLLCNVCDRKFRNYDQLYNHRYKVGHFIAKTYSNQINSKSLGVLVYQCEICGQWFTSIKLLQSHKGQFHPRYDTGNQCLMDNMNYKECRNYIFVPNKGESYVNELEDIENDH